MTWKGNFMTDGYAERRREYVANVRKSFEEEPQYAGRRQEEERQTGEFFSFFKIRLFLAVCLLGAFLYCRYTGTKIFHYSAEQIVELVSDNHYYTKLKNYVMIQEGYGAGASDSEKREDIFQ